MLGNHWRNLITEFKVTSTRTSLYDKQEPYADYIFVSPNIEVNQFRVLPDEVSDHAALYLDFGLCGSVEARSNKHQQGSSHIEVG